MTQARIFDTNVIINATGNYEQSPQNTPECAHQCLIQLMMTTMGKYRVVLDLTTTGSDILREYRQNIIPGSIGELFLQWILTHQGDVEHVAYIQLKKIAQDHYSEFPDDLGLKTFDLRDHKWIALAIAYQIKHSEKAIVVQSADTKWSQFTAIFARLEVEIDFICGSDVSASDKQIKQVDIKSRKGKKR